MSLKNISARAQEGVYINRKEKRLKQHRVALSMSSSNHHSRQGQWNSHYSQQAAHPPTFASTWPLENSQQTAQSGYYQQHLPPNQSRTKTFSVGTPVETCGHLTSSWGPHSSGGYPHVQPHPSTTSSRQQVPLSYAEWAVATGQPQQPDRQQHQSEGPNDFYRNSQQDHGSGFFGNNQRAPTYPQQQQANAPNPQSRNSTVPYWNPPSSTSSQPVQSYPSPPGDRFQSTTFAPPPTLGRQPSEHTSRVAPPWGFGPPTPPAGGWGHDRSMGDNPPHSKINANAFYSPPPPPPPPPPLSAVSLHSGPNTEMSGSPLPDSTGKQLIVNYLAPAVTNAELHRLFSPFGPLDGARVIYDRETSTSRGFGFVYFKDADSARAALAAMNGLELHGKWLRVGYSINPMPLSAGRRGLQRQRSSVRSTRSDPQQDSAPEDNENVEEVPDDSNQKSLELSTDGLSPTA